MHDTKQKCYILKGSHILCSICFDKSTLGRKVQVFNNRKKCWKTIKEIWIISQPSRRKPFNTCLSKSDFRKSIIEDAWMMLLFNQRHISIIFQHHDGILWGIANAMKRMLLRPWCMHIKRTFESSWRRRSIPHATKQGLWKLWVWLNLVHEKKWKSTQKW